METQLECHNLPQYYVANFLFHDYLRDRSIRTGSRVWDFLGVYFLTKTPLQKEWCGDAIHNIIYEGNGDLPSSMLPDTTDTAHHCLKLLEGRSLVLQTGWHG
jgi:hypothetical protein